MGHQGMKASLASRETIADSIELSVRGHSYDGLVGLAGCDKALPGVMMAMLRLNIPSVLFMEVQFFLELIKEKILQFKMCLKQ